MLSVGEKEQMTKVTFFLWVTANMIGQTSSPVTVDRAVQLLNCAPVIKTPFSEKPFSYRHGSCKVGKN